VAWHGNNGIMISMSGSYPDGHELFWIRFYNRKLLNTGYSFRYDTMYRADGILSGLAEDEEIKKNLTTVYSSTDDYIQFTFKYHYGGDIPQLPAQSLIFIYNIELVLMEDGEPYTEYRYKPADKGDTIPATGNPAISSTLTMPISPYRLNDHMIGDTVLGTKINTYPYLFAPRTEIRQRFRLTTPIADLFHAGKFYYLGRNWRVIAQAFYPWDDEYVLTLQYSSYL
jgi:hypothetical protein